MGQLETLLEMLKQTLKADGERIVEIVGTTILPRVHHLTPQFPFRRLFEGFGDSGAGWATQHAARDAVAHVVADLKKR
jgi:hypothetical protein